MSRANERLTPLSMKDFYTRLIKMKDPATECPLFATRCIELVCEECKEAGKVAKCVHLLHLVPSWQSEEHHRKLKIMMCVCLFVYGQRNATI